MGLFYKNLKNRIGLFWQEEKKKIKKQSLILFILTIVIAALFWLFPIIPNDGEPPEIPQSLEPNVTQTPNYTQDIEVINFKQGTSTPPFYYVGDKAEIIYDIQNNIKVPYNVTLYWRSPDFRITKCTEEFYVNNLSRDLDKYRKDCDLNDEGDWKVYLIVGYQDLNGTPIILPTQETTINVVKKQ